MLDRSRREPLPETVARAEREASVKGRKITVDTSITRFDETDIPTDRILVQDQNGKLIKYIRQDEMDKDLD